MKYSIEQTLYATLGEATYSKGYTKTDECCICVLFAQILRERNIDFDFFRHSLSELLLPDNVNLYKKELGDEFADFESDLAQLKDMI